MGKFKRCSILEHGNTGYSDSSKPADKAIEEYEKFILSQKQKVSIVANMIHIAKHSSDGYIDKIKKENATLKKSLSLAGELIEDLKEELSNANEKRNEYLDRINTPENYK